MPAIQTYAHSAQQPFEANERGSRLSCEVHGAHRVSFCSSSMSVGLMSHTKTGFGLPKNHPIGKGCDRARMYPIPRVVRGPSSNNITCNSIAALFPLETNANHFLHDWYRTPMRTTTAYLVPGKILGAFFCCR